MLQTSNQTLIRHLIVYGYNGGLVFDDPDKGLDKEAFVCGIDTMLFALMEKKNIQEKFKLTFSPVPFPGYEVKLDWLHKEMDGNWYRSEDLDISGWLCPALYKYFDEAPINLYIKIDSV